MKLNPFYKALSILLALVFLVIGIVYLDGLSTPPVVFSTSYRDSPDLISMPIGKPNDVVEVPGLIQSFDVSVDGGRIAIATTNGVFLYDLGTYKKLRVLDSPKNVFSVSWSPDGKMLAVGGVMAEFGKSGKTNLDIWDTTTWKIVYEPQTDQKYYALDFRVIEWSHDGRFLAVADYELGIAIMDVQTWNVIAEKMPLYGAPYSISWSPDDSRIVANGDLGYGFHKWRIDTGESVRLYDQRVNAPVALAWSPDGEKIASVHENGGVCLWTAKTNACDGFIKGHLSYASSLVWSEDGKFLATGAGVIRLWDVHTGRPVSEFGKKSGVIYTQLLWLSTDTMVSLEEGFISTAAPAIRIWDVKTGKVIVEFHGAAYPEN